MFELNRFATFLYGFAPRSALLCSNEAPPPGDGGAPPAQQPPPAVTQPASPSFTPEQLAYIESEKTRVSNAAAAAARREALGRQAKPGGDPPPATRAEPAAPVAAPDAMTVVSRLRAFDRAANRYGLSDSARDILEQDFNAASPQDPAAWVQQRADAFGWKASGTAPTATTPPAATVPGAAPSVAGTMTPPPMPGGAAPARVIDANTPIMQRSRADQAALAKQLGPFEFKKRLMSELAESGQRFPLRR